MAATRTYKLNEKFFNKIDTEEKAYILGFIMADGGIYMKNAHRLYFSLSYRDIEILNKIQAAMESNYDIKIIEQSNSFGESTIARLVLNSKTLVNDLIALGFDNNKTGNEFIPDIEPALIRHFLRGFFDGDGTIFKSRGYDTVGFTSSLDMLNAISELLSKELGLGIKKIYTESRNKQAYRLYYSRQEEVYKIYNYLYDNATIYLERKKDKFVDTITKLDQEKSKLDEMNNLRTNLKEFIKKNKIKQKDFAESIGVKPLWLNEFLTGRKKTISDEIQQKIIAKKENYDNALIQSLVNEK